MEGEDRYGDRSNGCYGCGEIRRFFNDEADDSFTDDEIEAMAAFALGLLFGAGLRSANEKNADNR
jgi:hypothetical protein